MVVTTLTPFDQLAEALRGRINTALAECSQFDAGCPEHLGEAIRYSLLAPGKRLRPILVLFAAEACGSTIDRALPAACAVEMVHAYSLIHDDLPAMDDDDLRRGRPTCHKVYGEALAILAGDALQARALEVIARDVKPPEVAAACCAALARAAGATGMVGGQADDLAGQVEIHRLVPAGEGETSETPNADNVITALESIHDRKTGAMINIALQLGGLVAQAKDTQMQAIQQYGRRLGLAFQIVDDLLDVSGDELVTGKRVHKDSKKGKVTFPSVLGVDESRRRARQMIDEACGAIARLGSGADNLQALARYVVERDR